MSRQAGLTAGVRGSGLAKRRFDHGFGGSFRPQGSVGQQAGDELGVQGVTRLVRHHERPQRPAHQGQVADQVQRLEIGRASCRERVYVLV